MKILNNIRKEWNKVPNSTKFWNGLILLILICVGIYNIGFLGLLLGLGSLVAIALIIDGDYVDGHLWIWFTPIMWFLSLFGLVVFCGVIIYGNTIVPFNNWLDKTKE